MDLSVYKRTVGARINLAFAAANGKVAKRRGGNEKHHSVVFEPHRDRAAARPAKTLPVKKVVSLVKLQKPNFTFELHARFLQYGRFDPLDQAFDVLAGSTAYVDDETCVLC